MLHFVRRHVCIQRTLIASTLRSNPWLKFIASDPKTFRYGRMNNLINCRTQATISGQHSSQDQPDRAQTLNRMEISIKDITGQTLDTCSIRRSFPNAKSTKFTSELERLLSLEIADDESNGTIRKQEKVSLNSHNGSIASDSLTIPSSESKTSITPEQQQQQQHRRYQTWQLTLENNGLHTTLLIPEPANNNESHSNPALEKLQQRIDQESTHLNHHPHISQIYNKALQTHMINILCTTHQPAGLSMKDVRLASKINEIVQELSSAVHRYLYLFNVDSLSPSSARSETDVEMAKIVESLRDENVNAAGRAVADPDSKCAVHARDGSSASQV